jgi:hypothetical protein
MKIKLGSLKKDQKLLDVRPVNAVYVSRYRQAYRAGKDLGKIIIDKNTKTIVSGNHRVTAMIEEYGLDKTIDVVALDFPNRQSILEKFVEENAAHGNPLTGFSRRQITLELLNEGANPGQIATLFGVATKRIEVWAGHNVINMNGELKPAKAHVPEGVPMSPEEYKVHTLVDRGIAPVSIAEQLTRWINQGLIDANCPKTIDALAALQNALSKFFRKQKAA